MYQLNNEQFVKRAIKTHGEKYDYSLVEYTKSTNKVKIICPKHGVFEQVAGEHLKGRNCPKCMQENSVKCAISKTKKTTEQFIEEAKETYGDKFDYSKTEYINSYTKVKIICPKHGVFEQLPNNFLKGHSCSLCSGRCDNLKSFVSLATKIHNNFYDYFLTNYIDAKTKVKIICPKHGVFEQSPNKHLQGRGCPKCKSSYGEARIRNYLKENNILFEEQKHFKELGRLSYDFYLPNENLLIEYNGIQHYEAVELFGGEEQFKKQQKNDKLKKQFAENNELKLLTISYKDYKIVKDILEKELKSE